MQTHLRLPPEALTILIDDREKLPFTFPGFKTEVTRLKVGDYAIKSMEDDAAIERKTLDDFGYYFNNRRNQLDDQIQRLLKIPHRILLIEATALDLELGYWPNADIATPKLVQETIASWIAKGLQVIYAGTHERASQFAADFLLRIANSYYETHHPFFNHLMGVPGVGLSQQSVTSQKDSPDNSAPDSSKQSLPLFQKLAA